MSKDKKGCKRLALPEHTAHHLTPRYIQLVCPLTAGRLLPNQLLFSLGRLITSGNLCSLRQWGKGFLEVCQAGAHLLLTSALLSFQPMLFAAMEHVVVFKERLGRDKIDHQSREKVKKLNVKPEQIIILANTSPSLLLDDAESF